ncbi:hypothetical protein GLOIN_2v1589406 [Rhizophagus irregularis DAOM 181602=DAOM 197198]|uniref:Uncharacterized protein n=1 Tax=Rhizophagus irregularis (strain DAOM 181602 / DAOM 197198 / MUCL 43194) TaxID=747089 RepID=A0A2P4Q679_RHIID|nr:hypothetical protein GLOIN_2v1589406 [Rhizophagus irregularis DAOM 181602=DAOM 197198]POG73124.1 hypothetical protein GLOIN_2v1589406 [Rhizophagus irregularis DAOM 181602=DAOM 197198]|eukprot:XP_025179990.1 hypothetical protein GLOIN_2v1589406 [Rhizophagus irregularis DAOM 181602=DAOM 197198]
MFSKISLRYTAPNLIVKIEAKRIFVFLLFLHLLEIYVVGNFPGVYPDVCSGKFFTSASDSLKVSFFESAS